MKQAHICTKPWLEAFYEQLNVGLPVCIKLPVLVDDDKRIKY